MIRYPYENWLRYLLGALVFSMALLLTPRALLDAGHQADSLEIPVNLLEDPDQCLWCFPQIQIGEEPCLDDQDQWLHPDQIQLHQLDEPCRDALSLEGTSA